MDEAILTADSWYEALTLGERAALLRDRGQQRALHAVDQDLADRRFESWLSQPAFQDPARFALRYSLEGLSEEEFRYLLAAPASTLKPRSEPPEWVRRLGHALSRPPSQERIVPAAQIAELPQAGFLDFAAPLIHQAGAELRQSLEALIGRYDDPPCSAESVVELFSSRLQISLLSAISSTLVLELNVARVMEQLDGDTPEERFQSFLKRLERLDERVRILREYPVLARQLELRTRSWIESVLEFVRHLLADWPAILKTFEPAAHPGMLAEVSSEAGDSHRGGRSVCLLRFDSGFKLVYKPRSLHLDQHFQELLMWLNARSDLFFRTLEVLSRKDHGWVEMVVPTECRDRSEVERFYRRLGGYLALSYALEATDVHFENVIAAGEHPVMIDLELLFHARYVKDEDDSSRRRAAHHLGHSVLRVGLLPSKVWSDAKQPEGVDLSGMGGATGQLLPRVPTWEGAGTDQMRQLRKSVPTTGGQNQPRLGGEVAVPSSYAGAIEDGFTSIYRLLLEHRTKLLAGDGPLASFATDESRFIVRATRSYAILLRYSLHSDFLQNGLHRDRFLDRLWEGIDLESELAGVAMAERRDLERGDIPFFITRPGARHLWSSDGELFVDFFKTTSMEEARARIESLDEDDLARQRWLVRASLSLSSDASPRKGVKVGFSEEVEVSLATSQDFLDAAVSVGEKLADRAFIGRDDATWVGLVQRHHDYSSVEPLGSDLYSGQPGLALFLAYLGELADVERFSDLARRSLLFVREKIDEGKSDIDNVGAFSGWGGWIYTLTHLSALWNDDTLLAEADAALESVLEIVPQDDAADVVMGAAGCLGALAARYKVRPDEAVAAAALCCGERLLATAKPMDPGIGWVTPLSGGKALTGFSHGAAGIAWALMELAELSGEERFQTAAVDALRYEQSLFSEEYGTWPNLLVLDRTAEMVDASYHPTDSWCHGAAGIGLSRLRLLDLLDDDTVATDLRRSLAFTLAHGFGDNHCLCHGDLGNLDFLIEASQGFDPFLRPLTRRIASLILQNLKEGGWLCGVPQAVETPGLMTGLAGIGYGLLRAADADRLPSILILAPPTICGGRGTRSVKLPVCVD